MRRSSAGRLFHTDGLETENAAFHGALKWSTGTTTHKIILMGHNFTRFETYKLTPHWPLQ